MTRIIIDLIMIVVLLAITLFATVQTAAAQERTCLDARPTTCLVYPNQVRYVAVHRGYFSPVDHWVPKDSAVAEVPFGTRLVVLDIDKSGEWFLSEHEGVQGWFNSHWTSATPQSVGTSSEQEIQPTEIGLEVYPNPSSGPVTVRASAEHAEVYDLLGRRVETVRTNEPVHLSLPAGRYVVRAGHETKLLTVL